MSDTALSPTCAPRFATLRSALSAVVEQLQAFTPSVMKLPRNAVFIFSTRRWDSRVAQLRHSLQRRTRLSPRTQVIQVCPEGAQDLVTGDRFDIDPTVLANIYHATNDDFVAVANAAYAGRGKRLTSVDAIEAALFI